MSEEYSKMVILDKEWKKSMNSLSESERVDAIMKLATEYAVEQGARYVDAMIKALEEKDDP